MHNNFIAHAANNLVFGEWVISQRLQPACPPNVNFYLWDTLKGKMYVNNPHSLQELTENTEQKVSTIQRQKPYCV